MTEDEFVEKIRVKLGTKVWRRLKRYARGGRVQWGRSSCEMGTLTGG